MRAILAINSGCLSMKMKASEGPFHAIILNTKLESESKRSGDPLPQLFVFGTTVG